MSRKEVLSLYRKVLKLAQEWTAASGLHSDTREERKYIREEAKHLFKKNSNMTKKDEIALAIHEANARIELALHYRNPYPRPVNLPPMAVAQAGKKLGKVQERRRRQAKPIYIKSYDEYDKN